MKAVVCLLFINLLLLRTCFASGTPPVITAQPASTTVPLSGSATFSVTASSGTTLTYQWMKNGASISGATSSSYTISSVQTSDAGGYSVQVVNAGGSVVSSTATLTVIVPPAITNQPQSLALSIGQTAVFSVGATGTLPMTYQWNFDGTNISGATNATLTLTNVETTQAGNYSVSVVNGAGSATSSNAALTVGPALVLISQPTNQTAIQGQTVTFTVVLGGGSGAGYIWYLNGSSYSSGSGLTSTVTITNVQPSSAGTWYLWADNLYNLLNGLSAVTTTNWTLTVLVPPTITNQPQSQTVTLGQSTTFSVGVSGTAPFYYQWCFNGTNIISGATNFSLTLGSPQATDAGNYSVMITNCAGSVTSSVAALTVNVPPAITTQPQNQTVIQGQTALFSVVASGTAPLSYQWSFSGTALPGATNSALTIPNVQLTNNSGSYAVVVTNVVGSVSSASATLTVLVPPTITTQPQSQTVVLTPGLNVSFVAAASGTTPLYYQWYFNGTNLSGATSASLTRTNIQTSIAGSYKVVVTNNVGSVTSAIATLTVYVPPTITTQPQNQTVTASSNATFSVVAAGTSPLTYQWSFNGTNLAGGTNVSLTLTNLQTTNAGSYAVVITNIAGSVRSAVATLTVNTKPVITSQPQSLSVPVGQTAAFSVTAGGSVPLRYRWLFNGKNISGATNTSLSLANVQTTNVGSYSVIVTNTAGSATSSVGTLTIVIPPAITNQPASLSLVSSQNATFSVGASGTSPFTYLWSFNGTNISSGTNSSLRLTNVQPANAGNYLVKVTNFAGSATSAVATLAVYVLPGIQAQPQNQTVLQGQTATFSVVTNASGTPPFSYQWNVNGTNTADGLNTSGSTNATLTLSNVQPAQAGSVFVVITNYAGAITSSVVTLTVNVPPTITNQPQSQTLTIGQTATFSVGAIGTATLVYQWFFNGTAMPGATNAVCAVCGLHATNAGRYTVVVTNIAGLTTSAAALLTVTNPVITLSAAGASPSVSGFTVQVSVPAGATYIILTSTDFINWSPIVTNTALTGGDLFTDAAATNFTGRFYRVMTW